MLPESPVADEDDALMSGSPKSTLETTASGADAATPVPRTFFSLLAIYVAPLSWALLREGVYTADRQDLPAYLSPYATVEGLVAWLGVNVALYGAQRAVDVLVEVERGDHDDPGRLRVGGERAGGLESVEAGHPDVHEHDVGAQPPGERHGVDAVARLAGSGARADAAASHHRLLAVAARARSRRARSRR